MHRKKKGLWILLILLLALLAGAAGGAVWINEHYHVVGMKLYSRDAKVLDLRGKNITISQYNTLRSKLPEAEIAWDVPFQGRAIADDTKHLSISRLTMADVERLDYLPRLQTVNGYTCDDYDALMALQQRRPEVKVRFFIPIGEEKYHQNSRQVESQSFTEQDLKNLEYLQDLETVVVTGGEQLENMDLVQEYCRENHLNFAVRAGITLVYDDMENVVLEYVNEENLNLLTFLENMESLHLYKPVASPESLLDLRKTYPNVDITWELEICGIPFTDDVKEVDLSQAAVSDLDYLASQMEYLTEAELLILGLGGFDNPDWGNSKAKNLAVCPFENEELAGFRDSVRDKYKVAWTVRLGPSIALRTDADNFMPNHFGVGVLTDEYAYNLRYCEDMVCLDVGHMTLTDIHFVEYMPKLKYLILAWTEVQYIEPIRTCKNLIFLELDNSCIRDYSPVADCTALQDLNIGNTYCDITPLLEMTWLKNLYMIYCSQRSAYLASQALPETRIAYRGNATVGAGWRRLPNYYDMRDCLGMYYMN